MCKEWFFSINIERYGRFEKIRVRILEYGNIVCMNIYLFLETVAYPMVLCVCVCTQPSSIRIKVLFIIYCITP